jgi:hypothetical protein
VVSASYNPGAFAVVGIGGVAGGAWSTSTTPVSGQSGPFVSIGGGVGPVNASESFSSSGNTLTGIAGVGVLGRAGGKAGNRYGGRKTAPFNKEFEGINASKLTKGGGSGEAGTTWVPYSVNCLTVALGSIIQHFASN